MLVQYLSNFSSYTVLYMIKYFKITVLCTMMYTLVVYNLYTIDFHPVVGLKKGRKPGEGVANTETEMKTVFRESA